MEPEKHESDLTPKERRRKRLDTIRSLHGRKNNLFPAHLCKKPRVQVRKLHENYKKKVPEWSAFSMLLRPEGWQLYPQTESPSNMYTLSHLRLRKPDISYPLLPAH